MTRWIRRLINMFRRERLERELVAELESHLGLETDRNLRAGMDPAEARRVAHARLGGVEQVKERWREGRPFRWLGGFGLDVKLGLRMLRKSWGLTLVGGLAMTVVIFVGAFVFSFLQTTYGSRVPLDEGDRIVALMTWDSVTNRRRPPSVPDFQRWRDALRSVEDVGAFQTVERSLVIADGSAEPVSIAEITAAGFVLARVPPLLGRPLVEEDERDGAAPVVVIGYDVWRSRFSSDPAVVGQRVSIGGTVHTVVGVMPDQFAFPVNHRFWTPLRADPSDDARDEGPEVFVFARLAPGVTLEGAQAELTTIGVLPAAAVLEPTERLHPRVVPYTLGLISDGSEDGMMAGLVLFLVTLLLVPPSANIAILVYARTVTRQEEFAARYALGASRGRIVGQIFVEVLVLAAAAAGVALVLVRLAGEYIQGIISNTNGVPFWMHFGDISFGMVLFAAGLAVFAATIAGVVPALQATGRLVQSGLRALGSRTGMQLGATWTALVVAQVAFSIAVLPVAVELAWGTLRPSILGPGFAAEEFLTARLVMDQRMQPNAEADPRPFASRFGDIQAELVRRLEAEPGVSAVTVSAAVPGREPWAEVEIDEIDGPPPAPAGAADRSSSIAVEFNHVDIVFFDVFAVPLLTGRRFDVGDIEPARAVIVNRTFAQHFAGDGNPLGRRVRYVSTIAGPAPESGPWYEIVGVVDDLPANTGRRRMYHPMAPGQIHPVSLALRVGPTAASVASRLREITTALDPTLLVDEVRPLDEVYRQSRAGNNIPAYLLAVVTLSVLLLSAAGMYALMSFTVARRRREIGIRSALGAQPRRLLAGVFKRALGQVAAGAVGGVLAALLLGYYLPIEEMGGWNVPGVVPAAAALMVVVGLLSAVGPARRGLRIEPTEALREG